MTQQHIYDPRPAGCLTVLLGITLATMRGLTGRKK